MISKLILTEKLKHLYCLFTLFLATVTMAQNNSFSYVDYYNAKHIINPAFTGREGALSAFINSNFSSDSFEKNSLFSITTPIKDSPASVGLIISNDQINITNTFKASPVFSYGLQLNGNGDQFRLGIVTSFESLTLDYDKLIIQADNNLTGTRTNSYIAIGAGAALYLNNTLISFNLPYLTKQNLKNDGDLNNNKRDFYFNSFFSQKITLSDAFYLVPSLQISGDNFNIKSSLVDVNVSGAYNKLTFGATYRLQSPTLDSNAKLFNAVGNTYGVFANFKLGERLNIGYAYKNLDFSNTFGVSYNSISIKYTWLENININDIF